MRSIRLLAVATGALVLGTACGDGGGTPPPDNRAPVAGFTEVCTELSCVFTDASTDADGNETITGWAWTFGDNTTANVKSPPAHAYATAGIKVVTLTVTDNAGATSTPPFSKNVTVGANVLPTASFTVNDCAGGTCVFTSTSTDADGTVAGYAWNFGEPASATNTSAEQHPTHTYAAVAQATPFTVTLTVTDDDGAASTVATQTVTIQPPASQLCTASGKTADCFLDITAQAKVTITLTSNDCHLGGSRFDIISLVPQQNIFFNGCLASQKGTVDVLNGPNSDKSFNPGTRIQTRFTRGEVFDPNDPAPGVPQITLEGSYPNWTMRIDDGGAPNLPRNDDLVLTITAGP